ncbi:MAG: pseudouridine synthase [Christensenellales bacterium]
MRLNKYIAYCGICSRRGADALIFSGRVSINGDKVTNPAIDINPDSNAVRVDGKKIHPEEKKVYIMLNKPAGVLCACGDKRGRKTVIDILGNINARVFPVGRLDYDTEGLLLLTNDGDFANRCIHPSQKVNKTYNAVVSGKIDNAGVKLLRKGVDIDGRVTARAEVELISKSKTTTDVCITIHEGRNRQVKKMFESIGCRVKSLKRVAIGELRVDGLAPGQWRHMQIKDFNNIGVMPDGV